MSNQINKNTNRDKWGSLKIYLGYAAGVGKTFEMLQEAHRLKSRGLDVAIGYLEPHDRPETVNEAIGLEVIPRRVYKIGATSYEEMDVQAVLARAPQFVLVDELAHTNAPQSENEKRYEDILVLLRAGLNVISTMNVQHLESVAEKVNIGTGVEVRERVPDLILQYADQIVTVDVSIEELRERLRTGKIYKKPQAERALLNFFTASNLAMLRETVFKEAAGDQSRRIDQQSLLSHQVAQLSHEIVMICLSSDPTNAQILIRRGTKMALQFSSRCFVVYVQKRTEGATAIDATLQRKIQNNLTLARRLGAEVVTLQEENIAEALAHFAIENRVRHAIFGKSRLSPLKERLRGSIILNFVYDAVGVDVHILSTARKDFT